MQCKRKEATLRSDQKWPKGVSHGQEWSEAIISTVLHHGPVGVPEERGLRVRAVTEPTGSPLGYLYLQSEQVFSGREVRVTHLP